MRAAGNRSCPRIRFWKLGTHGSLRSSHVKTMVSTVIFFQSIDTDTAASRPCLPGSGPLRGSRAWSSSSPGYGFALSQCCWKVKVFYHHMAPETYDQWVKDRVIWGDYKLVVQSMYTACAILAVFYHRIPDELKQLKLCEDWTWPISSLVYPLKAWWFSIVMLCWFTRGYGILWNGCRLSWWDSSCWLSDGFELELKQFWRVLL